MARSLSLKKKVTKTTGNIVNSKHMGDEPFHKGYEPSDLEYSRALTWYNMMCVRSDARDYLEVYLKNNGRTGEIKTLRRVPDIRVSEHAAWIARMLTRGVVLTQRSRDKMEELLQASYRFAEEPKPAKVEITEQPKATIQDRMRDKVSDFIGQFEEAIDKDGYTLSMYEWLQKHQIPAMLANKVAEFYKPIMTEIAEVTKRNADPQLKEGYRNYTPAKLKQMAAFYASIITDCQRHADNNKKQRVVRKKKVVSVDKKLKGFKHQIESKEFKVVSINPEKIIGAEELFTFNTKYRTLTRFIAAERSSLDVKGTTIINYDEGKSKTYRVGRKTEEHVATALRGGKRALNAMLESLNTCNLQHRINENTILLRI